MWMGTSQWEMGPLSCVSGGEFSLVLSGGLVMCVQLCCCYVVLHAQTRILITIRRGVNTTVHFCYVRMCRPVTINGKLMRPTFAHARKHGTSIRFGRRKQQRDCCCLQNRLRVICIVCMCVCMCLCVAHNAGSFGWIAVYLPWSPLPSVVGVCQATQSHGMYRLSLSVSANKQYTLHVKQINYFDSVTH